MRGSTGCQAHSGQPHDHKSGAWHGVALCTLHSRQLVWFTLFVQLRIRQHVYVAQLWPDICATLFAPCLLYFTPAVLFYYRQYLAVLPLQVTTGWISPPSSTSGAQKTITLTLPSNQPVIKTVQDVGNMPFTEFAALYAVGHTTVSVKLYFMASLDHLKVQYLYVVCRLMFTRLVAACWSYHSPAAAALTITLQRSCRDGHPNVNP